MTSPASSATDLWDIVSYEAEMLFGLDRILNSDLFHQYPEIVRYALVESTCLHIRILVDIMLSKNSAGKDDDITLGQLGLGQLIQDSEAIKELRKAYGDRRTEGSPCWTLNKMLAHPTRKRGKDYDYTNLIKQLLPLIKSVWQQIDTHHPQVRAQISGGFDPRFCAKTSSEFTGPPPGHQSCAKTNSEGTDSSPGLW